MKKVIAVLILLLAGSSSLFAQRFDRKGFALGADRDTLLYIIASPFDNWWINLGGGLQTFIGNEVESSARWNKLNYNLSAEIGKWIIPDLAVSLRLNFMNVDGQSSWFYCLIPVAAAHIYSFADAFFGTQWDSNPDANRFSFGVVPTFDKGVAGMLQMKF